MSPLPRLLTRAGLVLLVPFLLTSCGGEDTHALIMEDAFELMEEVATIVESIEDEPSARKATELLVSLRGDFERLAERNAAIGAPDEATVRELEEQFSKRRQEFESRLSAEKLQSVAKDEESPLHEAFQELGTAVGRMR